MSDNPGGGIFNCVCDYLRNNARLLSNALRNTQASQICDDAECFDTGTHLISPHTNLSPDDLSPQQQPNSGSGVEIPPTALLMFGLLLIALFFHLLSNSYRRAVPHRGKPVMPGRDNNLDDHQDRNDPPPPVQ